MVYKYIEVVGESSESFADATKNAIAEVGKTVDQMQWFEVTSLRGAIKNRKVSRFQVCVKIGFKVKR